MADVDLEDGGCEHGSDPECCVICMARAAIFSNHQGIADWKARATAAEAQLAEERAKSDKHMLLQNQNGMTAVALSDKLTAAEKAAERLRHHVTVLRVAGGDLATAVTRLGNPGGTHWPGCEQSHYSCACLAAWASAL